MRSAKPGNHLKLNFKQSFVKKISNERTERKADFTCDLTKNGTLLLITEKQSFKIYKGRKETSIQRLLYSGYKVFKNRSWCQPSSHKTVTVVFRGTASNIVSSLS